MSNHWECRAVGRSSRKPLWLTAALVAGIVLWTLPTDASAQIQVTDVTWGQGATPVFYPNGCISGEVVPDGNLTLFAIFKCDGQLNCTFNLVSDVDLNGNGIFGEFPDDDPAFGCSKPLNASEYTCVSDGISRTASLSGLDLTFSCPAPPASDSDDDGIIDDDDECSGTATGAPVDAVGCSGAQLVELQCPQYGPYKNHGKYVSCVSRAAEAALEDGLLTEEEKDAIVSTAAKSRIGKKK